MLEADTAVVGGGLVGMAIAYGLQRQGARVTVYDEGDDALRAARGNFGLVWIQGKGAQLPEYARWSRRSAALWPEFAAELLEYSGRDVELHQPGGLDYCLSEADAEATVARLQGLRDALDGDYPFEYLDAKAVRELMPDVGPKVVGATFGPEDGHVNPLYLLHALVRAFIVRGGQIKINATVTEVQARGSDFLLRCAGQPDIAYGHVVLAAGHGNRKLAPSVGLRAPVSPSRGQVLVTERLQRRLHYPSVQIRQVGEGAVQIGDSNERVGFDDSTRPDVVASIAKRAVAIYPFLERVRMVRSWAALRVMSEDGYPIYDRSVVFPGAAVASCHSGVTLAAAHALELAPWLLRSDPAVEHSNAIRLESFSAKRFSTS